MAVADSTLTVEGGGVAGAVGGVEGAALVMAFEGGGVAGTAGAPGIDTSITIRLGSFRLLVVTSLVVGPSRTTRTVESSY